MENDNTPITPPTAAEASDLNRKWDDWDKKQKRGTLWQVAVGVSAVFGLVVAAAAPHLLNDETPDCPPNPDQLEMDKDTAAAPLRNGSTLTLKDGSACIVRFTP